MQKYVSIFRSAGNVIKLSLFWPLSDPARSRSVVNDPEKNIGYRVYIDASSIHAV